MFNSPSAVGLASNKLFALSALENVTLTVPYTTEVEIARDWAQDHKVFCRHLLRGSGGRGITVAHNPDEVVAAPLYTRYVKKKREFRVHVFDGEPIRVQEKRRKLEVPDEDVDWLVRTHDTGFVFCQEDVEPDDKVLSVAVAAVTGLGLLFGAADVLWNEHEGCAYVCEVNSAAGMEGTTLSVFVESIRNWFKENYDYGF